MSNKTLIGEYPFTVEARVAIQLGRESISSSLVAVGELIKNAYDADAEEVVISFKGLGTDHPFIAITDDGDGMNKETLLSKWMRIGTTHKSELGKSTRQRVYTGAKGLGRLGLDRLCTKLNLYTKTAIDSCIYEAEVFWEKYNKVKSAELDSIRHEVYEIPSVDLVNQGFPLNKKSKGSQYILSGLKDKWDVDFLSELRKELSLLVSPFSKDLGFKIKFETNGAYPDLDGFVSSDHFLEAAEWRLEAAITEKNMVTLSIFEGSEKTSNTSQPAAWSSWIKGNAEVPLCGPLDFKLYFMKNVSSRKIDTNKFKSKDVKSFLKNNQGVRVYRDNFRVKPYGDPSGEGDWLSLAMRRVINPESITMDNWRIGYNQVVGAVFIGRDKNPNLVDQTNREGLTETPAYFELKAFALKCVELFERHIQQKAKEQKDSKNSDLPLSEVVEESVDAYKGILETLGKLKTTTKDRETKKQLKALEVSLNKENERTASFKERIDQLEAEKDTLANLASLGILSVSFGHETLAAISNAIASSELLKTKVNEGMFMLPLDTVEFANKRFTQIDNSLNYIKIFGNFSLGNVRRDKRTRRVIDISQVVSNVFSSFSEMLDKRKISYSVINLSSKPLFIKAYEIDWESIFANLITNSCWALSDTSADNRKVEITLNNDGGDCVIFFEDSGCGIEAGVEDHIFKATFSTKRNRKGESVGTGMGLSIVRTFVEEHSRGRVELASDSRLGGAKFVIRVPSVQGGD